MTQADADSIVAQEAAKAGISWQQIVSRRRLPEYVQVRIRAAQRLRLLGLSYPAIGRALNREHATVMWYCAKPSSELQLGGLGTDE